MLLNGKKIEKPEDEVIVIPRKQGDIVFKAQAVTDYKEFEQLCPPPNPPEVIRPGGIRSRDPNAPEYLKALDEWARNKTAWMILKSLSATEGLKWETVDMSKPETWQNYFTELVDSGFLPAEIFSITDTVMSACGLNQKKIDEAMERFLAGQQVPQGSVSSQNTEQNTTVSGEPAND
jgi:hypothetical protein